MYVDIYFCINCTTIAFLPANMEKGLISSLLILCNGDCRVVGLKGVQPRAADTTATVNKLTFMSFFPLGSLKLCCSASWLWQTCKKTRSYIA